MKNNWIAAASLAATALCASVSASQAASLEPGETMGLFALSPLPEGVFVLDNENYGGVNSAQHSGVNIPLGVWSTPWVIQNTRVEFLAAVPFAHYDGNAPGSLNHLGLITAAYGVILAHDFGGGFTGGGAAILRTQDPDAVFAAASGRGTLQGDFRGGLYYTGGGWNLAETSWITTSFGGNALNNDSIGVDFSVTHSFDKLEAGLVGFAYTDITNHVATGFPKTSEVELGGLIGYNFGPVTVQAMVTHAVSTTANGISAPNETRGWLRLIIPVWVAPTQVAAAPLKARY